MSESVRKLAEYTIARHDPALVAAPQPFLALLRPWSSVRRP